MGDFCGHIVRLTDNPADTPIDMSGDIIYAPISQKTIGSGVRSFNEQFKAKFVAKQNNSLHTH